eukprot:CAMPEP_0204527094 /NCGR_PEP_ID=MMETSP0661-20131031/8790_1 /ASSEMBLY_ACC=CAM_ASM_000606 /TAXON_ID=109239 /ORGANISM="Alexandrium margalefi, Strain AMGDE01CS-322" /LENGTH=376 /DNA_ID=CAMNT_0051532971 /DNA_START=42 /DNA_END=1172 /DNA_ORIENTATION=-
MAAEPQTSQEAALEYKSFTDAQIAALSDEVNALRGKEHHKDRHEKGRIVAALRAQSRYVDACRVSKGLPPLHGFFACAGGKDQDGALDSEEAARLAAEAEQALKELEPKVDETPHVELPKQGLPAGIEDQLFEEWGTRMSRLEKKAGPHEAAPEEVDELQAIAQEVVDYKERLHRACGYRNKDIKEDRRLHLLEDRLDALAAAMLPDFGAPGPAPEAEGRPGAGGTAGDAAELKCRAQQLAAKMVRRHEEVTGLSPSEAREVEKLLVEITELKASMTVEGLPEHQQDRDERVFQRMLRVSELRQKEHHDKKHDQHRHKAKGHDELRAELEQLRAGLGSHKQRLRDELGYGQKDLRRDPEVAELEERLAALHRFGGA